MEDVVATFARDGCAVARGLLSDLEVATCRDGLHADLRHLGIDHSSVRCKNQLGCVVKWS
jgi:hypothetical protein